MRMSVCRAYVFLILGMFGLLTVPSTVSAQYRPVESGANGENYHIEGSFNWWNAEPSLSVNSESLGILGTDIDLITDLGIEKHTLPVLNITLKPGRKHRLRFQRLPISYETDAHRVTRSFVFNGQLYTVGLPVTTTVDFTTYGFGYQYDFLYFSRGFVGAGVGLKYTNGFTRLWPSVVTVGGMLISFWLLALAMKSLPLGTAYAVWVGIGTVGAFVAGIVLFGESTSWLRIASVAFIVLGLVGLKLSSP